MPFNPELNWAQKMTKSFYLSNKLNLYYLFSEKFKEQTNNKVPLKHSPIIQGLILNMTVKS